MALSAPTTFVAHEVSGFSAVGTDFAAYSVPTEEWVGPASWATSISNARFTQAMREFTDVWRSVSDGVMQAAMPALFGSIRNLHTTAFVEVAAVLRSTLRDVVLGATWTTGELRWAIAAPPAQSVEVDADPTNLGGVEEDRRLYALAAVEKLQRLLRLNQDEVSALIRVSRPTLWNWQQGRTPQERSLRHLYDVAGAVDVVVDSVGGEELFDPLRAATQLGLDAPLAELLLQDRGPRSVLDRVFATARKASRSSTMPTAAELGEPEFLDETAPSVSPPDTHRRQVRRRSVG